MDDLISRQAAKDYIDSQKGRPFIGCTIGEAMKIMLDEVPSAQPEIIRCKDCKNSEHWYKDRRRCFLWSEDGISVFDDGFCNYGEGKERDGNAYE